MSRYLFVTWDGAGNLVPTLALVDELVERGHDVRVLGHASLAWRAEGKRWRFRPFDEAGDFSGHVASDPENEIAGHAAGIWFNPAVARDTTAELGREATDVVIGDAMLTPALCAGLAAGVPTVALFHAAYSLNRGGPLVEMFEPFVPLLNETRAALGQAPVTGVADVHDECARSLVFLPQEFDVPMDGVPVNVRWVGPALDGPPLVDEADEVVTSDGPDPLVLVSFSTSHMGQGPMLQQVLDALSSLAARVVLTTGPAIDPASLRAPGNAQVVRFVPHEQVVPHASLVVTHAGLGTVLRALTHGVPMVCVPMGRDQFFNGMRVEAVGAGTMLGPDAGPDAIRDAVAAALADDAVADGAKRMASTIASYRGAGEAADEVEGLAG